MSAGNEKFARIFESVDTDKSGRITAGELQKALEGTGENVTLEACHLLISLFDDGTGSINIQGLAGLFELSASWKNVFTNFDKDGSGFIDSQELRVALKSIFTHHQFNDNYVQMLVTKFGRQGRDGLNDEEFLLACAFVQKPIPKK